MEHQKAIMKETTEEYRREPIPKTLVKGVRKRMWFNEKNKKGDDDRHQGKSSRETKQ